MKHFTRLASSALLPATLAAFASLTAACGWNEVETGRNGLVEFVPDECGHDSCDLDDGLAVGAVTDVYLNGVEGANVDDLHLESSAPWIADVVDSDLDITTPRFKIQGYEPGYVDLIAVDRWGYAIDSITIEVAPIDQVSITGFGAQLSGPFAGADGADVYYGKAGMDLTFDVDSFAGGQQILGAFDYAYAIEGTSPVTQLPDSDGAKGHLTFNAPAGEYDLSFAAPGGMSERVHVSID